MTISYPLTMPSNGWRVRTITRFSAVAVATSPLSGVNQVQAWPHQKWMLMVTLAPMSIVQAMEWAGFFGELNGREGTFMCGDDARPFPRGSARQAPGTPLVNGAGQTGNNLNIDGAPVSALNYLEKGDYFGLGATTAQRMYMITQKTATNASGAATLQFWPKLRSSPADNDPIYLFKPMTKFRLDDAVPETADITGIYSASFNATEDL